MKPSLSRRNFVQNCAWGALALAARPVLGFRCTGESLAASATGAAKLTANLDQGWLFGGKFTPAAFAPGFDDTGFTRITLPHCVAKLSWQKWNVDDWHDVWAYRRHFSLPPEFRGLRVFAHFSGVMVGSTPAINGHLLPQHMGGYLPSRYELTDWLTGADNVLAVAVDSRWSNVPPEGSPIGAKRVDYLEPGGIYRSVCLQAVPQIFISDVFAKPVKVLDASRRIDVTVSLDAASLASKPLRVRVELRDGARVLSHSEREVRLEKAGHSDVALALEDLGNVAFWEVDAPRLYDVVVTLFLAGKPVHDYRVRTGLRDARFELEGFFLNGRRLQLFGLNRHELYPYVGGAMPRRVMRRDAETLRRDFNCNIVRCSHYPQSEAFLEACDELGLMAWEEPPGWGYLGDDAWKDLVVRDVHDMIVRDRNHPAIVIWGVRINESANDQPLYRRTTAVAKALDDSRPTSGSMTGGSRKNWETEWHQDVFAHDDYHSDPDGTVGIWDPTPGVPYMLAEAVGQFNYSSGKGFGAIYRRAGDLALQEQQGLRHAQAHSKAAANPRNCGVIAWCAFDYASLVSSFQGVKCPGVADVFRIPKLGAGFYRTQTGLRSPPLILPNFYWDFGARTPRGPGQHAAIFSNCERLEVFIDGKKHATLLPDSVAYPHLPHPPFFTDLDLDGASHPELRIEGYVGEKRVLSRSFSSDSAQDNLLLETDDTALIADGADATRVSVRPVDKFGADRPFVGGEVGWRLQGPGVIVGDNPLSLADTGGVGAVWIKTIPRRSGRLTLTAAHSLLGAKTVEIDVLPSPGDAGTI